MGGRRAASLGEVLGSSRSAPKLERELREGLRKKDPEILTKAARDVAAKVIEPSLLAAHLKLLVPFVSERLRSPRPSADIRSDVRAEWSRLKREHGIRETATVNDAVVHAVIDVLRGKT